VSRIIKEDLSTGTLDKDKEESETEENSTTSSTLLEGTGTDRGRDLGKKKARAASACLFLKTPCSFNPITNVRKKKCRLSLSCCIRWSNGVRNKALLLWETRNGSCANAW
jgi:hypothetical protein